MRCKYEGCMITTKNGQKHSNWRRWQLCKIHAWELHSDELPAKFKTGKMNRDKSKK